MSLDPRLLGERVEQYGVDLLDFNGNVILTMPVDPGDGTGLVCGVTAGSIAFNLDSTIMASCSLTIIDVDGLIDWMTARFRPWITVNGMSWNLGVYVPASPDTKYLSSGGVEIDVTCGCKTTILDQQCTDSTLAYAAGTVVTDAVNAIIYDCTTDTQTNIVPSTKTLASPLVEAPGTSYLAVVNALLGAIAYDDIWTDLEGVFTSEPWIDPASQVPTVYFTEGDQCIHSADFEVTQDTVAVPNKVICVTTGDDSNPALISIATNVDDSSPYSFDNRGGIWVTQFYDGVPATDQAALDAIAQKNLKLNSTPPWYVDVTHAAVPLVGRQVVQFTSAGIDRQVSVNEWGLTLTPGALMTGKWLGVAS